MQMKSVLVLSLHGLQYDAGTNIVLQVLGWCWNRLDFYSSIVSPALAGVQSIRSSKNNIMEYNLTSEKNNFFP